MQNRDKKKIGMVVKIIHQRVSVLHHNVILCQRHLSNRFFNLEMEHFCVKSWNVNENVCKHNVREHSKRQS